MAKCFIIFGQTNKKLLLPLFLTLSQIIYFLVNKYLLKDQKFNVVEMLILSLGQISIRLIPHIIKISIEKNEKNLKLKKKKKCLHYFLLCLLCYLNIALGFIANCFKFKLPIFLESNLFPNEDFMLTINLEMIVLILISICLLKYKYFKHHIISLVFSLISGIFCYIILNNNKVQNTVVLITRIIQAGVEAIYICYQKYLMEKFYYPYWNMAFVPGIILLVLSVMVIIFGSLPFFKIKYFSIISYFDNGIGESIAKLILILILHIIMSPLTILIIFYFSPNFILIVFLFTCITKNLIEKPNKFYCIPFYLFQIFALFIHLEILELNFCGLNKNTKRNINLRAKEDFLDEDMDSSVDINYIEIENNYGIEFQEKKDNENESEKDTNDAITEKID